MRPKLSLRQAEPKPTTTLKGLFFAKRDRGRPFHVITNRIEHPLAVLEPCSFLQRSGRK